MHQSSQILKALGGVPQECLKQGEIFSVQIQWRPPQAVKPKNNRQTDDTSVNKWIQAGERLIYFGRG
jgi:hypothetical protein